MKEHKVYELVDLEGQIVDVGYTGGSLEVRLHQHTKWKSHKWYGRTDLAIRLFLIYPTRREAELAEGARKLELGMTWTEHERNIKGAKAGGLIGGKLGGKVTQSIVYTCPHCGTQMKGSTYFQWHHDRCKHKERVPLE